MASLYQVKVISINQEDKSLTLDINSFHPDALYFSDNLGFAMRLLHDSATGTSALGKAIDPACLFNKYWLAQNVKGFISGCELMEVHSADDTEIKYNGKYHYWRAEAGQPGAKVRIKVTDSAWLSHLSANSQWKSSAYDAEVDYVSRETIAPKSEEGVFSQDYQNSGGWIAINPEVLDFDTKSWPKQVYLPKYSVKSYRRADKMTQNDLSPAVIGQLLFKTVFVLTRSGNKAFGLFFPVDGKFGVMQFLNTGRSGAFFELSEIVTFGVAEFNVNDDTKVIVFG
ncbi:MAG: hypothetical protein EOO45_08670 [Flavobacterium sp.]|nr:MAG: hypothetical protein EOO45_08670 [Flavobacterium sp.]